MKIIVKDGKEYVYNDKSGSYRQLGRLYTLDDGSKVTVNQVVKKIKGCTNTCARARLKKHTDPKIIYRPVRTQTTSQGRHQPSRSEMLNPQTWYIDPLVKLMLK